MPKLNHYDQNIFVDYQDILIVVLFL